LAGPPRGWPGRPLALRAGTDRGDAPVDVLLRGVPAADADPHRLAAAPGRRAAPAGPAVLDRGDDRVGAFRIAERHDDLIEHDLVQHVVAGLRHPAGEPP